MKMITISWRPFKSKSKELIVSIPIQTNIVVKSFRNQQNTIINLRIEMKWICFANGFISIFIAELIRTVCFSIIYWLPALMRKKVKGERRLGNHFCDQLTIQHTNQDSYLTFGWGRCRRSCHSWPFSIIWGVRHWKYAWIAV